MLMAVPILANLYQIIKDHVYQRQTQKLPKRNNLSLGFWQYNTPLKKWAFYVSFEIRSFQFK